MELELAALRKLYLTGRRFPDQNLLKQEKKATSFYTVVIPWL